MSKRHINFDSHIGDDIEVKVHGYYWPATPDTREEPGSEAEAEINTVIDSAGKGYAFDDLSGEDQERLNLRAMEAAQDEAEGEAEERERSRGA